MKTRMNRGLHSVAAVALLLAGLTGCVGADAEPLPTRTPTDSSLKPTSTPTPAATLAVESPAVPAPAPQAPQPLVTISGTVADTGGQSLTVTIAVVDVQPLTTQDRKDLAAAACETAYDPAILADPEARMVTMSVEAVGSPGFVAWTDDRGVVVNGTLFSGPIWRQPAKAPGESCIAPSRIVEPGHGSTRLFASANWNVPKPLPEDGAITLTTYGFRAQTANALGQPTGMAAVQGCTTATSPELDALVIATAPRVQWGQNVPLPEYCFIGRNPGGLN